MDVLEQVAEFIHAHALLQPSQRLLAGVSGGPDSLCLMDCLHRLGYPLIVAHLDHQLRPESPREAEFVRQTARSYGLKVVVERQDVASAGGTGTSLEEAARLARYRFLARVAKECGVERIAVGHTADDQVETVLMHLLRGAGPSGLRGMMPATPLEAWVGIPEAAGMVVVRPLLEVTRGQARRYCEVRGLQPRRDRSNLDMTFFRNRLRHHLIPILEDYNPAIRQVLLRTAQVMAGEAEMVADLVDERWPKLIREAGARALAIHSEGFLDEPKALQRALLREAIHQLRPTLRDVGFEVVERALECISRQQSGERHSLVGDLELVVLYEEALIWEPGTPITFPRFPQLRSDRPIDLPVPGQVQLSDGWRLSAHVQEISESTLRTLTVDQGGFVAALDQRALDSPLVLRSRKPGDRIRPLGMEGSLKVANLFVNERIPSLARDRWPLVVCGERLLWVVRLRMSAEARLRQDSRRAVVLRLLPPEDGDHVGA